MSTRAAGTSDRRTFVVSRGLEYFTESELQMQIGASRDTWPVAVLKELIDNALDATETADVAPMIEVDIKPDGFTVADNGPGLPAATIERSLDYQVRVSDKLGYVTPTRGRLGNALKVLWAAPFVAAGTGRITVHAAGYRHDVQVAIDQIERRPAIRHDVSPDGAGPGTRIEVGWPDSASLLRDDRQHDSYKRTGRPTARELIEAFAAFNPHATFRLDGEEITATAPAWKKWTVQNKLVAHWYALDTFRELVANYIASERYGADPITVRAFVAGFRGLTSTAKQKTVTDGFKRDYLNDLAVDGDLDQDGLETLLERMQAASRAPKPAALGVIGREHMAGWLVDHAAVAPGSIQYRKAVGFEGAMPYVIEIAFGVSQDDGASRRIVTGLNWSPTLDVPASVIRDVLQEMRVDPCDPVVVAIHLAKPFWDFTGRGKETVTL